MHHAPDRNDCHITAGSANVRLSERDEKVVCWNVSLRVVERLMLDKNDRRVLPQRRLEQSFAISRGRWYCHLQAGVVREPGIKRMSVLRTRVAHRSHRTANHHGDLDFSVRKVVNGSGLLYDLRHGFENKIEKHLIHYGTAAIHSSADGYSRFS